MFENDAGGDVGAGLDLHPSNSTASVCKAQQTCGDIYLQCLRMMLKVMLVQGLTFTRRTVQRQCARLDRHVVICTSSLENDVGADAVEGSGLHPFKPFCSPD